MPQKPRRYNCQQDILDQGQVPKYFCRISLVMYLVYNNHSNAGPECQAMVWVVICNKKEDKRQIDVHNTIPNFDNRRKKPFENIVGKGENAGTAFSPFPTVFSNHSKTNFNLSVAFILSPAVALNLDQSKILFFGKKLGLSSIYTHFNTLKKKASGKHCWNRWNCSKWAISPFSTTFSMQSVS